jgi:site-specific DNA recombinase
MHTGSTLSREGSQAVAGYTRASSTEQVLTGHTLDAQDDAIHRFADQREYKLVRIYEDAGISGTRSDRPALKELLEDAEKGLFDVVVVHSVDRFFRDLQGLLKALNHLQKHGVSFVSITENIDFTTPWGKLALAVLGTLAEIYIDKLSAETKKGKRARARKGLYNGHLPLGYCKGNCSSCTDLNGEGYCPRFGGPDLKNEEPSLPLHVHPVESEAIRLAFEWYITGHASDGDIAERLNDYAYTLEDGTVVRFRTKGAPGRFPPGRFRKNSVRELLQHPFYVGKVPYFGRDRSGRRRKRNNPDALYDGLHPALVSEADFAQAQRLREQAGHRNRDGNGHPRVYPLSGLLACWQCRRKMRVNTSNGSRYYNDTTRIERIGNCDQPAIPGEEIEAQVADVLRGICPPSDWKERIDEMFFSGKDLTNVRAEDVRIRARMDRATELYLEGAIDKARFQEERRLCERALSDLYPPEKSGIIQAGLFLERFDKQWSQAVAPGQKNRLLRFAVIVAFASGSKLVAIQLKKPFYAMMQFWRSGSDGKRRSCKTRVDITPPSWNPGHLKRKGCGC